MCPGGIQHAFDQRSRVALLDVYVEPPCVELAGYEQFVDDVREPTGLLDDNLEQLRFHRVLELEVFASKRQRRAVDRCKRRTQLVRDRGDEVLADLLESSLLREVAERIDRALVEADAGDLQPVCVS